MRKSISPRSFLFELEEKQNNLLNTHMEETDKLVASINQEVASFSNAVKRFVENGEFDAQALKVTTENQEKLTYKKGRPNRRKISVLAVNIRKVSKGRPKRKKPVVAESTQENESKVKKVLVLSSTGAIPKVPRKTRQDDMLDPSWIPPKNKVKEVKTERPSEIITRSKGKKASVRDSDVVVQNTPITTIYLSDTDESDGDKALPKEEKTIRSTRTKTKKEEEPAEASDVTEKRSTRTKALRKGKKVEDEKKKVEPRVIITRSRRAKEKETKDLEEATCEVAIPGSLLAFPQQQLDSTSVASSSKTTNANKKVQDPPLNSTMVIKPSVANAANSTVPMFTDDESIEATMSTPLGSKFLPSSCSTARISRLITHQSNPFSNESLLAMKSAQNESPDRQRKQMVRERKLNEEKQLKAQQQRKVSEADKQKQLEQQKQKEARLKQRELEREEHLRQQKYEHEKKGSEK